MTTHAETRKILVAGATGRQGRAFIDALRPDPPAPGAAPTPALFRVLALTRNTTSPIAKDLAFEPHVDVIQGDLDSKDSIRKVFDDAGGKGAIWGVFVVLAFPGLGANADGEERQGINIADLALEYGVSTFVFSSVERGGEAFDDTLELDRAAKVKIERHVKALGERGLRWTILRPTFFMENFEGTIGSITAGVLRCGLQPTTKIQLVTASDIGHVAAAVFKDPESSAAKALVIAGDVLTTAEQDESYVRGTGKHLPAASSLVARPLLAMNAATKGLISDIERVHRTHVDDPAGYEAHLAEARAVYPASRMTTFEEWARRRDANARSEKREKGWNGVSLGKLFTGRQ